MLDITFYSTTSKKPISLSCSEELYQWLIQSDFSEIGVSRPHTITLDDEAVCLYLVDLNKGYIPNRQRLRAFLVEATMQEVNTMLNQLGDEPSSQAYQAATYKLRKLQELRHYIEDEAYQYLERI